MVLVVSKVAFFIETFRKFHSMNSSGVVNSEAITTAFDALDTVTTLNVNSLTTSKWFEVVEALRADALSIYCDRSIL